MLGARQPAVAKLLNGFLHRVKGVTWGSQHGKFGQRVKGLIQTARTFRRKLFGRRREFHHRHAVDRQRSGFIYRQYRNGAQRLDCGDASRQYPLFRDAPGPQCQKHRQDDRNFLRQNGHGQRDPSQQTVQQ